MSSNQIILASLFLTGVWLIGVVILIGHSEPCALVDGLTSKWISCRKSNEIGDFLAGAFAPLAFLWLVATVFIQSASLKKQSEELELSREEQRLIRQEMQLNRIAMEAQLDEAKKNLVLVKQQIEIERKTSASIVSRQKDDATFEILGAALDIFDQSLRGKRVFTHERKNYDLTAVNEASGLEQRLRSLKGPIVELSSAYMKVPSSIRPAVSGLASWKEFYDLLDQAVVLLPACSEGRQATVASSGAVELHKAVRLMIMGGHT